MMEVNRQAEHGDPAIAADVRRARKPDAAGMVVVGAVLEDAERGALVVRDALCKRLEVDSLRGLDVAVVAVPEGRGQDILSAIFSGVK